MQATFSHDETSPLLGTVRSGKRPNAARNPSRPALLHRRTVSSISLPATTSPTVEERTRNMFYGLLLVAGLIVCCCCLILAWNAAPNLLGGRDLDPTTVATGAQGAIEYSLPAEVVDALPDAQLPESVMHTN